MAERPTVRELAALAVLLLAAGIAVAPALDAPFTFDEHVGIGSNRALRPDSPVSTALAYRFSPDQIRPLFFLSLQIDARLFGTHPRGFRITNLVLHLLTALVLLALLRRVAPGGAALAGTALFLLHPVQSESIIYIWARSGVLSTLFALLALLCALRADGPRRVLAWCGALASVTLALLAKEEAVALPLIFLAWWTLGENRPLGAGARRAALLAAPVALFLAARAIALGEVGRQVYVRGIGENILGQAVVTLKMLWLALGPIGQSVDHPVTTPPAALGVAALLGCAALLGGAALLARAPSIARCGAAGRQVAGGLGVAAAACLLYWVVPLPDLMSERRFYLPMTGAALAIAGLVGAIPTSRARATTALPPATLPPAALIPAALLAIVLAPLLHHRALVWADPARLWEEAARHAPERARPLINLGVMAAEAGDLATAATRFDRAVALEPENPEALYNRGRLRLDGGDLRGAEADLAAAVGHGPLMARAHINLGVARIRLGDLAAAETALRDALDLDPDEPRALTNLAETLRSTGRGDEAIPLYHRALEADPAYAHAAVRLGVALEARGDRDGALRAYREYLRRGPPGPGEQEAALRRIEALEAESR